MPAMTFRGCRIRYIDIRRDEGGMFTRLHVSTDYSDTVARKMEWPDEIPAVVKQGKLSGLLSLSNFILTPNDKALQVHEINLKAHEASDFQLHRSGGNEEEGEVPKTELRFTMRTSDIDAPARLGTYFNMIGEGQAALKLDYAQQEKLDLNDASNEGAKEEVEQEPATQEDETAAAGPILQRPHGVPSRPGINRQRNRRGGDDSVLADDEGQPVLTGEAAEQHEALRRKAKAQPGVN